MRTVTLTAGEAAEDVRRAVEAAGVRLDWHRGEEVAQGGAALLLGTLSERLRAQVRPMALVRPFRSIEGVAGAAGGLDVVLIDALDPSDRKRFVHFSFTWAATHARQKVTMARNEPDAVFADVARDYPQIVSEQVPPEALAARLRREPDACDVVLCGDDEVVDACARLVADPTLCPGAVFGERAAVFMAGHRRAIFPAAAMMLEHLNEGMAADRIVRAFERVIAAGGEPSCDELVRALATRRGT